MASWLEYYNVFVNASTLNTLNEISSSQRTAASIAFVAEKQAKNDNALLSELVDILVKARQFNLDKQYLDAVMTVDFGLITFKNYYPYILDADKKLKSSDVQLNLVSILNSIIGNSQIKSDLVKSILDYLNSLENQIELKFKELKNFAFNPISLDDDDVWEVSIGEYCIADSNLFRPNTNIILFKKDFLYSVTQLKKGDREGFYLINEEGQKHLLHYEENGCADDFIFFDPSIPSLQNEAYGWELFDKVFNESFLKENLKSVYIEMTSIINESYELAKTTNENIKGNLLAFDNLLNKRIAAFLQSKYLKDDAAKTEQDNINKEKNKIPVIHFVSYGILFVILLVVIILYVTK